MKDQEEMFEAATELPAFMGCPALGPKTLPSGFDGVEPAKNLSGSETLPPQGEDAGKRGGGVSPAQKEANGQDARSTGKAKLEKTYLAMRGRLEKIADIALAADAKCGVSGRIGQNWMTCSKAIGEIRRICKQTFAEEVVLDYEWLAKIMTSDHFDPECLAKAIEAEASQRPIDYPTFFTPGWLVDLAKKLCGSETLPPQGEAERGGGVPPAPLTPEEQSARDREIARQKRKIHWTAYPTKVDVCVMGKTEQNGKVYEVRISKRGDAKVQDTYGQCKVNGKTVITCSFIGSAWMLQRILTGGMQALVNYKAKRKRARRRNYAKRKAAASGSETLPLQGEGSRGGAVSAAQKEVK